MFKKLIKILMLLLVVSFFAIILRYYFSEKNIDQKKQNRYNLETKVLEIKLVSINKKWLLKTMVVLETGLCKP